MNKGFLIELTKNLYRLTLLFPQKEPLRYKMRELADDILANLTRLFLNSLGGKLTQDKSAPVLEEAMEKLEILDGFFEIAKTQNWVKQDDILAAQKEYAILKGELEKAKAENPINEATLHLIPVAAAAATIPDQTVPAEMKDNFILLGSEKMTERQEKIMAFLREQGRAQVWQIKLILPEVTKRTLRRDFDDLLKKGAIERIGERNNTFYQLKTVQV